jgi:hypothetical protein
MEPARLWSTNNGNYAIGGPLHAAHLRCVVGFRREHWLQARGGRKEVVGSTLHPGIGAGLTVE